MSTTLLQPQANLFSTDKSNIDLLIEKKEFNIFTEDCTCIIDKVEFVKIIDLKTNMALPVLDTTQATTSATPRKGISKFVSRLFNRMAVLPLTLPLCLVLVLGVGNVWGQILTFEFSALAGHEATANSNFNNSGLTSSIISRGAGLTAGANAQRYNALSWATTSIANAVSGNDYMEFTLTPNSGKQFSVSSIVVQWQRSSTGNTQIALRSSVNNYSSDLDAVKSVIDVTTTQTFTWTFAQANSSTAVTYRFYSYAESTTGTGGPGDGTGNDITVNGSVSDVATAPTLTTPVVSSITTTSATLGATVSSNGGAALSSRGTVWGTSASPTGNLLAEGGTTVAAFTHSRTSLTANTFYYYRGYAVNSVGTGYSAGGTFTTLPLAPTVGTGNSITSSGFTANWSHPTMGSASYTYTVEVDDDNAFGSINSPVSSIASSNTSQAITGLAASTTYYYRVKAVNAQGSSDWSSTSSGVTTSAAISPTLNPVTLASALSSTYGTASTGVSFTVSGSNLTSNITATAQSGYEVSTSSGSGYGASVSVTAGTTVFVRFASTISSGNKDNAIAVVLSGGGTSSSANVTSSSSGNTVSQKALTVTGLTAQNKVYDGLTTATASGTAALSGVVSPDVVSLTGTPTFTFSSANVGTGISVSTSGYSLIGGDAANYTLTQPTLSANITVRSLTITANDVNKYAGVALTGGAGSTAFTSSGLQNSETIGSVTITYGSAGSTTGDGNTVGVYASQITPSLATGGTFNSANYSISYVAGSITVISAPIAIAIQDFEIVPATPTLGFTNSSGSYSTGTNGASGLPSNANLYSEGSRGWQTSGVTSTLNFNNFSLTSYVNSYFTLRLAGMSVNNTNGIDAGDIVTIAVSIDNGVTYSNELTIAGSTSNQRWDFSSTGTSTITYDGNNSATAITSSSGSGGISTITINLPNDITQAKLRITLLNNNIDERWVIDNVKLIGTINTSPKIFVSQTSLTGFSQNSSTPSSEQSYTVSGDNLTNDVTITPPAGYEISTSTGGSFSATNPITLSASGGNLVGEPVTIYVRQSASTLGVISGNITHSSTGANSPNVAVSGTRTGSYYSKATGNLDDINSWGSNTDGSGSNPSNFSTDGIIYEIRNRTTATIGANWTVTGTASKVVVGDGTNSTDFTIPSGFVLTGTVDVSNAAELTIENTTAPTFGTFATNSTLEYKDLPITLSTSTTYKNLKLTGSGTKTFPGGTTNVTGNLIFTNTTIDGGSGPFSTISLNGDLTYVGTVTPPADANSITLSTNGTAGGTQTIIGAGNTLRWFRIQSTTANTILLSTNGGSGNLHVGNGSGGGITLVNGSILNMNGNDFTLFSSAGTTSAFILNSTASISTTASTDFTIERTGNGNLGTLRFTSGSNTIGNLTLKHIGITNNLLFLGSALAINGTLTLTTGVLSVGANTLSLNGSINRSSGFIDASNAAATIVFGGSSSQNIPASTFSGNIANLTLNNGSGLSTGQNLTIASGLSLTSGTLTVGANTLTLNGSINQTTGNIDASNASATVVFGGSSAQSIPASTFTGNINNLTLNNSAGLSISQDLSVVGALTLSSGTLSLGTNHLTLGENATTSGTFSSTNMIIATGLGELRKRFTQGSGDIASFTFPVGNIGGVAEYTPIVLDFASGNYGANAYVSVRVQDSKQGTLNSSVTNYLNRNWIVEPNDITGFSYKIQLYYVDADFITDGTMAEGDLKPIKISSGQWYQPTDGSFTNALSQGSAGVFANSNYLEWNGLTTFSEFGGAGGSNLPLPVELLSFTAECGQETILLKWQTASEFNSAYFEIQKSLDGSTWNTIGNQTAAGNSTELLSYSLEDASKSANTSYYRLNQVDNDGLQKFYGPISPLCESIIIHLNGKTIPNPSNNEFWLQISSAEQQKFTYILQDINGSKIMENSADLLPGSNLFPIRETIPSGMYFILLQTENGQQQVIKHIRN